MQTEGMRAKHSSACADEYQEDLVHLGQMSGQENHRLSILELRDCDSVKKKKKKNIKSKLPSDSSSSSSRYTGYNWLWYVLAKFKFKFQPILNLKQVCSWLKPNLQCLFLFTFQYLYSSPEVLFCASRLESTRILIPTHNASEAHMRLCQICSSYKRTKNIF